MKKIITIIAISILIIAIIVWIVTFTFKTQEKSYSRAIMAERILNTSRTVSMTNVRNGKYGEYYFDYLFYPMGSRIENGKLYISLYDSEKISREEQKKNALLILSEYADIIEFEFYTHDYIVSVQEELEEHFSNSHINKYFTPSL